MRKTLTVAWREFRHTAMTKAFVFGAIIMPILMMGLFIVVIPLLESTEEPLQGTVIVVAPDDVLAELQVKVSENDSTETSLFYSSIVGIFFSYINVLSIPWRTLWISYIELISAFVNGASYHQAADM